MDLDYIGEAEDRISELPDSLIHHILSFLEIECVAQTAVLSKRWKCLWNSVPILVFPNWHRMSLSETDTFMEFVDATLLLHDTSSNIQKFHLKTTKHMSAPRVYSWIKYLTMRNVEEFYLSLDHRKPFLIPLSLFTCKSLIRLELVGHNATHLPRSFCFPKLKSLKLYGILFTDDCSWNEQHFSDCPVLESLTLGFCTWSHVRNFCISIPTLKLLEIYNSRDTDDGLRNCALKIDAPNLASLLYCGSVAKEYVLSCFRTLESAEVLFYEYGGVQRDIGYGAAVRKFFRALSHVQCPEIYAETLETLSTVDDFVNILPHVFRDVDELILKEGETTDKSIFLLLKALPNLRWLLFEESCIDENTEEHNWDDHMLTSGPMFQHLETVYIVRFSGNSRQMRWVKLILETANTLEAVILSLRSDDAINKEVVMSDLQSLQRVSDGCEFEFKEY